jgi:hypothetical protein
MNPKKTSPPSRASEVWERFVGMFGGDAVRRKFGDAPPAEWVGVLAQISDYQLERGMRRLLASGKANIPSLPEFRKLCVMLAHDDLDEAAPQGLALPAPDTWTGDAWDMSATRHLLAHILRQMQLKRCYDPRETKILVSYKNAWARDMREEADSNREVPVERQRKCWDETMQRADAEITALRLQSVA